jgi:hypothetical protein
MRAKWVVRDRVARLLAIAFVACQSEPKRQAKELPVRADCRTPEVTTCLQGYAFEELESADIDKLIVEGIPRCFSGDAAVIQCSCLPLDVGHDKRIDKRVSVFCTDQRSGNLRIGVRYPATDLNACCDAGGFPVSLSGRYAGCRPPEYWNSKTFFRERARDLCRSRR